MLRSRRMAAARTLAGLAIVGWAASAHAQVDESRANVYFKETAALCERDAGRLWGVSLCGPIAIADAATRTLATSQAAPAAPRPAALGFANAAVDWGGTRWATIVWQLIPPDPQLRARMFLHELFHRVQPDLGLTTRDQPNDHLDTIDGRYWMQLEWRALAKGLGTTGPAAARRRCATRWRFAPSGDRLLTSPKPSGSLR